MKWFKCCFCNKILDESYFYKDKSKTSGYKPRCKKCDRLSLDIQKRKEYERNYRIKNYQKRKDIVLRSIRKNIEHHKNIQTQYRKTDNFHILHRKHGATRRARMANAFIEQVNYQEIYLQANKKCYYCGIDLLFSNAEFDHYIPISKGGKHEFSNIKCSCIKCNRAKAASLPQEVSNQVV